MIQEHAGSLESRVADQRQLVALRRATGRKSRFGGPFSVRVNFSPRGFLRLPYLRDLINCLIRLQVVPPPAVIILNT